MNRTQLVLAGLFLAQVVLIALLRSPGGSGGDTVEPRALLPDLGSIEASRIEIAGPDDARVNLRRAAGRWSVEEAGGFPADAKKIDDLLDDLEAIRVRRPVVTSSRYHKTFKVREDENEGRLRVWDDAQDTPRVDLILGDSPNYRITHVRVAGEDRVYEARGIAPYDIRAATTTWVVKELVEVREAEVSELALTNAAGAFRLVRDGAAWKLAEPAALAGRALDPGRVSELVRVAGSLRLDDPVGPVDEQAHGFATPAASVELKWSPADAEGGTPGEAHIRIGAKVPSQDTQRYVTRVGFGFTGTIWDSSVTKLLEQKVTDLLAGA